MRNRCTIVLSNFDDICEYVASGKIRVCQGRLVVVQKTPGRIDVDFAVIWRSKILDLLRSDDLTGIMSLAYSIAVAPSSENNRASFNIILYLEPVLGAWGERVLPELGIVLSGELAAIVLDLDSLVDVV